MGENDNIPQMTPSFENICRKDENGTFRDIAHPITPEARHTLEETILDRYQTHLAQAEAEQAATPHIPA